MTAPLYAEYASDRRTAVRPLPPVWSPDPRALLPQAVDIRRRALEQWGPRKLTAIVGRDPQLAATLDRATRLARADHPTLITGETGTGKELFARAIYLLSERAKRPFQTANCAQYADGGLVASELFGHRRGSFTGAVADRKGLFEEADGGVLFLDEVGELTMPAQSMLLRALGEGEVVPVGETRPRPVDVRVIAATSRDLKAMVAAGTFREDLYYRLRYLHLHVPPVRDRGDDWRLILFDHLAYLAQRTSSRKSFSPAALDVLAKHGWPGNVRELKGLVDSAFFVTDDDVIEPCAFALQLESAARTRQLQGISVSMHVASDPLRRMTEDGVTFWEAVHGPFLNRELSRAEAREVVAQGLDRSRGSYRRLLPIFNVAANDYLRFMDFLRHQKLKPE
jgi:two-component system response regulator AtoC